MKLNLIYDMPANGFLKFKAEETQNIQLFKFCLFDCQRFWFFGDEIWELLLKSCKRKK
jgi:hypothetical protein